VRVDNPFNEGGAGILGSPRGGKGKFTKGGRGSKFENPDGGGGKLGNCGGSGKSFKLGGGGKRGIPIGGTTNLDILLV
jgi:hypothetical protein